MDAKLKVIDGAKDAVIRLKLPTIVGRGAESSLKVPQSEVSRSHCEIYEEDGLLAVYDLGSANGTFVNGERIEDPTFLYPGDHLKIGNVTVEAVYVPAEGAVQDASSEEPAEASAAVASSASAKSATSDSAVAAEDAPVEKSAAKDPVKRTADSSAGLSGVSAIVDYSENPDTQGGSFIAIQEIDAIGADDAHPAAAVSSFDLDAGADEKTPEVSSFSLDADAEEGGDAVDGGDSKLNDFFRNLE